MPGGRGAPSRLCDRCYLHLRGWHRPLPSNLAIGAIDLPQRYPALAKKPNYNFEKRKKELDKKAKREEKMLRKRENAARGEDDVSPDDASAAPESDIESSPESAISEE